MASEQDELTCQELVELVTDYLEGALAPDERARFEAHLDGCGGCRSHLAQMRHTLAALRGTAGLEARPDVAVLLDAFRDWKRPA
jgi:anti-sigma factor RsiW